MDPDSSLRTEVTRLRKQLLITQLAGAIALVACVLLIAQRKGPPEPPTPLAETSTVSTRGLVLVDDRGNERATLRCSRSGQPSLTLIGAEGAKIELGFMGEKTFDLPGLTFKDARDRNKVSLSSVVGDPVGGTGLAFADDAGDVVMSLNHSPSVGTVLSLKPTGDRRAHAMFSMISGFPTIQLIDANGKHVLDVPPLQ